MLFFICIIFLPFIASDNELNSFLQFSDTFSKYFAVEDKLCILNRNDDLTASLPNWKISGNLHHEFTGQLLIAFYSTEIDELQNIFNHTSIIIITKDDVFDARFTNNLRFDSKLFTISKSGVIYELYSLTSFKGPSLIRKRLGKWNKEDLSIDFEGRNQHIWDRRTDLQGIQLTSVILPYR